MIIWFYCCFKFCESHFELLKVYIYASLHLSLKSKQIFHLQSCHVTDTCVITTLYVSSTLGVFQLCAYQRTHAEPPPSNVPDSWMTAHWCLSVVRIKSNHTHPVCFLWYIKIKYASFGDIWTDTILKHSTWYILKPPDFTRNGWKRQ